MGSGNAVVFWFFAAIGGLGLLATVGCLKKLWGMRRAHRSAVFWALVLLSCSAYVVYTVASRAL